MHRGRMRWKRLGLSVTANNYMARFIGIVIAVLFTVPLVVGFVGSVLPAVGGLPQFAPGNGWQDLITDPRFWPSILLSLKTGVLSTIFIVSVTLLSLVCAHGTQLWRWLMAFLPPLLAVPHAAMAVGLVFLVSPSGWLVRLISPELSGLERPPTAWVVPDSGGWTLILGLVIKETPFLLLAAAAHLSTVNVSLSLRIGRTLGYSSARCWRRLILPQIYARTRLTLFIILAFNLSVVDVALVLGPGNPPTFAVFLLSLVSEPESRAAASVGALLLAAGVVAVIGIVVLMEKLIGFCAAYRRENGHRGKTVKSLRHVGLIAVASLLIVSVGAMAMLLLWSVARRWRFPDAFPSQWTADNWLSRADLLLSPLMSTLLFAVFVVVVATTTAIAWLECERTNKVPKLDWLWYVPLFIPQVTLLFGWQAAALLLRMDGQWLTVAYAHWVYTLPYVILILAVAWREFDPNWHNAAAILGAGYWRILWQVRLPLLIKPVAQAAAVALAVSVAQYLPTLLLGAGRHQTLSIELVTSFGGVDRRVIATLAALQSLLPLLAFIAALGLPRLISPERKDSNAVT